MEKNTVTAVDKEKLKPLYFAALEEGEQKIQDFFETYSEVFPLPFYLGHHLDWNALVSKYPIDSSIETDFMYVTRTSFHLNVVFVELEDPVKKIFVPKGVHIPMSAEFTKADAQIKSWRDYVSDHRESLLKRIATLIPFPWLRMAKVEFRYVLIFGRESEFQNRDDRKKRFRELTNDEFYYLTYDSAWNWFERHRTPARRHILKLKKDKFTFKTIAGCSTNGLFAHLGPDCFVVSEEHRKELTARGYDLDAWDNGELLAIGGKQPFRPDYFPK